VLVIINFHVFTVVFTSPPLPFQAPIPQPGITPCVYRLATLKMVEEIYSLYTIFWSRRNISVRYKHYWVWCTAQTPQPWGYSRCNPGDLRRALRENFGCGAVGSTAILDPRNKSDYLTSVVVLVDGELWTDESVLWQNKLQDRAEYEVVYRTTPQPQPRRQKKDKLSNRSLKIGKPWCFQLLQLYMDRQAGVIWDADVPHAAIAPDEPPKVKVMHGPSRKVGQQHLPPECGSYWGVGDPRNGMLLREVRELNDGPPPPYSER